MLTSNYAKNGLEVSIQWNSQSELEARVITDHYRRLDVLTDKEREHVTEQAQLLWVAGTGSSPFDNFSRIYHGMIY